MTYRFLRISTFYPDYLENFYRKFSFKNLSYLELKEKIYSDCFAQANFYEKYLQKLGVKADSIIANDINLQRIWAKENNLAISKNWQKEIVISQIKKYQPNVLYLQDHIFSIEAIKMLRNHINDLKLIIGFSCSPFKDLIDIFKEYDFMLTCTPCFVHEFKKYHIKAYLMYHAFEPEILNKCRIPDFNDRKNDLIFIGQISPKQDFHIKRLIFINSLLKNGINLQILASMPKIGKKGFIKIIIYYFLNLLNILPNIKNFILKNPVINKINLEMKNRTELLTKRIQKQLQKPVFGIEMFKQLNNAKIGFNSHIDIAGCCAGNLRLFEVTGCGALLLTDRKNNMSDLFIEDKEVVLYDNFEEAIIKIEWLLNNPDKIKEIALAGQKRTFKEHNYYNRSKFLHGLILKNLH